MRLLHKNDMQKSVTSSLLFILCVLLFTSCNGQESYQHSNVDKLKSRIGGPCETCELMYIDMPEQIQATDTSAGWNDEGQKLLIIGTVYQQNGKVPASGILIYYWQTDSNGYYSSSENTNPDVKRHGDIRGWVKTDKNGKYAIYTNKPAAYPNRDSPAHIHILVKEPQLKNEYYIDEFVFDDEPLLTTEKRKALENRGGSGVLRVLNDQNFQVAEKDIILGLNIPDYPQTKTAIQSGLQIGEDSPSFTPFHAWGPDKGSKACPVCKYGRYQGVLYFVGEHPEWDEIKNWLVFLEKESVNRGKYLKVYFIYGNEENYKKEKRFAELENIGKELKLQNLALTFVPSFNDRESDVYLNKINPLVENTFILYRYRTIIDKYINLKPTEENFQLITTSLDNHKRIYFQLPEPKFE